MKELETKVLTNEKLIEMSKTIINALKNAKSDTNVKLDNIDWFDLEEEWFDWLKEELIECEHEFIPTNSKYKSITEMVCVDCGKIID